ncbi:MAG: CHC2 zinc finger domain-containing protein [bacterium]
MSSQVEQIKERLGIADVVGAYLKLEKAGGNYKARCPFHNEKTPSFFLSPARSSYYCFGCGAKGDIFTFVQEFEGLDFVGALKVLAQKAGVELVKEDPKMRSERQRLFLCLESATIFFQRTLYENAQYKAVVEYLTGRGLTKETIKEWRIGYAPDAWQMLSDYLKGKRFSEQDMEKVGLIKPREAKEGPTSATATVGAGVASASASSFGTGYYDRFRGRIMFPLFDSSGRVIGFSGRIFGEDDGKSAKYLNSPETELFKKSEMLYGFHKAKLGIREKGYSILVEGQMDMLMSQQAGFVNTVAVSGTALTLQHLELLRRLSERVVMSFDPDGAGVRAALRGAEMAIGLGMEVRVAELPKGEDPALFILNHPDQWREVVEKKAIHVVEFVVNHLLSMKLDGRALAKEVGAKVLPFIVRLTSSMERSHFVSMIYKKTGIKEEAIWEDVKRLEKMVPVQTAQALQTTQVSQKASTVNVPASSTSGSTYTDFVQNATRRKHIERRLASIVLWQNTLPTPMFGNEEMIKKLSSALQPVQSAISGNGLVGGASEGMSDISAEKVLANVMAEFQKETEELIVEAELSYDKSEKLAEEVKELLENFVTECSNELCAKLLSDLHKAQRDGDGLKVDQLVTTLAKLKKVR